MRLVQGVVVTVALLVALVLLRVALLAPVEVIIEVLRVVVVRMRMVWLVPVQMSHWCRWLYWYCCAR